jgi:hypothetical protein
MISARITEARAKDPPPPMPWIERPVINTAKSSVTQQITAPMAKMPIFESNTGLRPNMSERLTVKGWTTAETRR